ncbi:MAG: hypothetical protein V3R16_02520 [Nitrospirales bacterium]
MSTKPENPELFTELETLSGARLISSNITLRDLFAAAALAGFCANPVKLSPPLTRGKIANMAFDIADHLLAEREKS